MYSLIEGAGNVWLELHRVSISFWPPTSAKLPKALSDELSALEQRLS